MQDITHLFFDIDHTLWDFDKNSTHTLSYLYDYYQLNNKRIGDFEEFNKVYHDINDKLWDRFRKGFIDRQTLRWKRMWHTLLHYNIYDITLAKDMSEKYLEILPTQTALFPHAEEVLIYCKNKKYQLHIITNGFETTQKQKLQIAGIDIYFEKMISSEQAMSMKPKKEIFQYALRSTQALAQHSVMIGDALDVDILGAQNAGMHQIYFNPNKKKENHSATYEIHCLSEIKNIL